MKTLITIALLTFTLLAQERVLLRIGPNGQQEAIPLKKGEQTRDVIERLENQRTSMVSPDNTAGLVDTLKYFISESELTTNFGWVHQDVAMQWFSPQAPGTVKEFWWLNYLNRGVINKGTIRAWLIDPRVANLPVSPPTKYIGTYKSPSDGDGGVQPFKPATGNQWFYSNGEADSVTYSFDLFTKEAAWLEGGLQVKLDSNKWQGIKLSDWGDSMNVAIDQLFGFTLSNDTRKEDIGSGVDTRMEILSLDKSVGVPNVPFHSFKFYETGRTAPANAGWHMRGDYEWGMYVVMEVTSGERTKITVGAYGTTLSTAPRLITATISNSNPAGGPSGIASARLFSKIGRNAAYDSVTMTNTGTTYSGYTKATVAGDTVYWYIVATTTSGNRTVTPARSYLIFKISKPFLFIYNNAGFSRSNANLIYHNDSRFDYWSIFTDGTDQMSTLLGLFNNILVVDGAFPSHNVYPALKQRLSHAIIPVPVAVFITSQDYGCFIQQQCADTTFGPGSLEYDYLGLSKIGPQDVPPANREFRVVPQSDAMTNYLISFGNDNGSTLWCDPSFELGFSSYQDNLVVRPGAKVLLTDGSSNAWGVKYITSTTRSFFASIDVGALQFRSDTSLTAVADPKYNWVPTDVGSLTNSFFYRYGFCYDCPPIPVDTILTVGDNNTKHFEFGLAQNYPNPFNPVTSISYSVAASGPVTISVYNAIGQRVAVLVNETKSAGEYRAEWNASHMASGLYFYKLQAGSFVDVKKMMYIK